MSVRYLFTATQSDVCRTIICNSNNFLLLYSPNSQYSVVARKIAHRSTGKII